MELRVVFQILKKLINIRIPITFHQKLIKTATFAQKYTIEDSALIHTEKIEENRQCSLVARKGELKK